MSYVNTTTLEKLTWRDIKAAHSNTSFPEGAWSDELLEPFGYANLNYPEIVNDLKPYEEFVEGDPILAVDGKWYRSFTKRNVEVNSGNEAEFVSSEKEKITAKIAAHRYLREISGTMVDNGEGAVFFLLTDRESQMMVTSTFTAMANGVLTSVNWKINSSTWITLDLQLIQLMANVLATHVQSCFTWERDKLAQLRTIDTFQELLTFARDPENAILFRN